jgi:hypothetical protein
MIIWNADAYTRQEVRRAVVYILGTMKAAREDVDQATLLV